MKSVVLSVLASGAAAQITLGPLGGLGLSPELFQNAAINPSDPEYATCQDAVSLVQKCVSSVGGLDAAPTADAEALVACACCDGSDNAAPLYSVCSKYLEDEAPENTSQYEAYGTLYSACKISGAKCTGGSGSGSGSGSSGSASASSRPTATEEDDRSTITTQTSPAQQTYASACVDMLGIFTSCTAKDRDFTNLPFKEQAECYCCRGSGNSLTWTDAMDKYAQTCADWARTGESKTAYSVAQTFATFCERFSNVCEFASAQTQGSDSDETTQASTTENSSSRQTDDSSDDSETSSSSNNSEDDGPATVTVPGQPTETDNDATSARAGFGAVLAVVAALAITL
ncbi:queuine trna-ribosyltransferase [Fusarium langsethiae]|uniref:Queuine trna-ribosyltransferase n=1 Tax=Fusarium langsethiae TaxID=179993 RepID=A0A0M9F0E6_FUSLA|nr:queuine trna-ribosyltransferase [Fusarium langsethiae]GKU01497.1 unnamed protein product [Fusarium langsethiae]GKU11353.1 unnamed protein product [Fusarium langsethiae]